jgi:hypothetical protein
MLSPSWATSILLEETQLVQMNYYIDVIDAL